MSSSRSLQLPRASLCTLSSFTMKNRGWGSWPRCPKSRFSLGAEALFLSFCGRALARKLEGNVCRESRLCFGTYQQGCSPPVCHLGPAWLRDRKERICLIAVKFAGKAACGSGGEPSAPALREPPRRRVRSRGRYHLD